jgi:hypothetical protein
MKIIFPDGTTYNSVDVPQPPAYPPLWRIKHDIEMGGIWRGGLPEVFPLNGDVTPFGKGWQKLTYAMNPGILKKKWRAVYRFDKAFMNKTGFDRPGYPKADFINNVDLTSPLPKWDKTRVCGGATVTGHVEGAYLVIDILDGHTVAPTLEWILARPWYFFHAVNCASDGHITNFPQNDGRPVLVPLVGHGVAKIALSKVQQVTEIVNPYQTKF